MVRRERRKAAALGRKKKKTTTTAAPPALDPELVEANADHQLEAGLSAVVSSHEHDRYAHVARAPPRPLRTKAALLKRFTGVPAACFSISTFSVAHSLSEAMYFKLRGQGRGPRELRIGTRVLITFEAAAEWRAKMERETAAATAAE